MHPVRRVAGDVGQIHEQRVIEVLQRLPLVSDLDIDGPVVLVGHSYGGVVITDTGSDPRVVGLVYIAAFAADKGESVNTVIADPPPGAPVPPILAPRDGYLFLDRDQFHDSFAGDLPADEAAFMADSQTSWGVDALGGSVSEPGCPSPGGHLPWFAVDRRRCR